MKSLFLYLCLASVLTEISLRTRKRKEAGKDRKKEGREGGGGNKEEINKKKKEKSSSLCELALFGALHQPAPGQAFYSSASVFTFCLHHAGGSLESLKVLSEPAPSVQT